MAEHGKTRADAFTLGWTLLPRMASRLGNRVTGTTSLDFSNRSSEVTLNLSVSIQPSSGECHI
jgi:hypothetical protein